MEISESLPKTSRHFYLPAAEADQGTGMVMEEAPTPQSVGREFVRQYYTLLNSAPTHLHRFYNHNSLFIHDGLETSHRETKPMVGQKQIHQKIQQLNFVDCHAKITQVDSQATLGNGVVVQVTGELSNGGQPMRRFTQTFVLASQSPKMYYVHNDIFRYQDMGDDDGEHDSGRSETDEDVDPTPQPQSQYYMNPPGAQPAHHTVLSAQAQPLQGGSPTPLMNPTTVNGSIHIDEHTGLPSQAYMGMAMTMVPAPAAAPTSAPATATASAPAATPAAVPAAAPVPASAHSATPASQPPSATSTATAPSTGSVAPQAPTSTPTPAPTLSTGAPSEEREEPTSATEECQEESVEASPSQGGAALQAQSEAADPEVQQSQQPKEDTSAEEKGQAFEELQLQEPVASEPLTYATLLKGSGGGHKPAGRTTVSSPPPPPRSENHTSGSTTSTSGTSGAGAGSVVGVPRSNSTRPLPRGMVNVRGMSRSSVDRQGPPRSSLNDDSSGDNRRRSSSNQYPDSHQIFVGNVPLSAEESDLRNIFSQFGPISEVRLHSNSNKPNNKNRNYAFVTFEESSSVQLVFQKAPINYPGDNGNGGQLNVEKKQPRSRPMQGGSMRGNQSGPPRGPGGPGGPNGPSGPSPRGRPGVYSRGDGAPGGPGGPRNSGGGGGGGGGGSGARSGGYQNRR